MVDPAVLADVQIGSGEHGNQRSFGHGDLPDECEILLSVIAPKELMNEMA